MNAKWCIATYAKPLNFDEFIKIVKSAAAEGQLEVFGYVVGYGRNCNNHGIMLSGDETEQERFITQITMALMPAKYSRCSDNDPAVNEGVFVNHLDNEGE